MDCIVHGVAKSWTRLSNLVAHHVRLSVTQWTVACQSPLSMEFPRQEHWHGCYFLLQHMGVGVCLLLFYVIFLNLIAYEISYE